MPAGVAMHLDRHPSGAGRTEFHRVRQQVDDDLHKLVVIRLHRRQAFRTAALSAIRLSLNNCPVAAIASPTTSLTSRLDDLPVEAARLDLGKVEDLVDKPRQPLDLLDDDGQELAALRFGISGLSCRISENERIEVSGVRNSCVTVVRNSSLSRSSSSRRNIGGAQFARGELQLLRFLLELPAVFDHLGGLVEHLQTSSNPTFSPLTTEATMTRAEAAPTAPASSRSVNLHEVGVRHAGLRRCEAALGRIVGELALRPPPANETRDQVQQIGARRLAAPPPRDRWHRPG